jgi:hypothetical protein
MLLPQSLKVLIRMLRAGHRQTHHELDNISPSQALEKFVKQEVGKQSGEDIVYSNTRGLATGDSFVTCI